jgi:hypothetical protein
MSRKVEKFGLGFKGMGKWGNGEMGIGIKNNISLKP